MRLQLTIQRQGLPPTKVLWNSEALRPNHVGNGASTTVAQFLEQINEVIPLEAEDWGLEDYAVEVRGFECLHYCSASIFKDDDHVTIRPLQTLDIRYRRASGRHQISSDGKHLVDGVAFGRPFLRRSDRPAVRIPARKRIRLTYEDGEENENTSGLHDTVQELTRSTSDYIDNGQPEGYEDFGDDGLHEHESGDLATELKGLIGDLQPFELVSGNEPVFSGDSGNSKRSTRSKKRFSGHEHGLGLQGSGLLELMEGIDNRLTEQYNNPLLDQYYQDDVAINRPSGVKHREFQKRKVSKGLLRKAPSPELRSRRDSSASIKSVRFEGDDNETPATICEIPGSESEDDEDFEPSSDSASNSTESDKENLMPGRTTRKARKLQEQEVKIASDIDTSSSSSDTESSSSVTSSSLDSSSDTSSSSDDSHAVDQQYRTTIAPAKSLNGTQAVPKGDSNEYKAQKQLSLASSAPGQGQIRTKKRNERRKMRKKILYLQGIGVLPAAATGLDYSTWIEDQTASTRGENSAHKQHSNLQDANLTAVLEAKRQALIDSITLDRLDDVQDEAQPQNEPTRDNPSDIHELFTKAPLPTPSMISQADIELPTYLKHKEKQNNRVHNDSGDTPGAAAATSKAPKQRSKLDLSSSRRLLFGSLGLKTPKTKEDELKLRADLMKTVRLPLQSRAEKGDEADGEVSQSGKINEQDGSWKDNLVLKAVECCREGVVLSTPPFPFFQRWDPQQQGRSEIGSNSQKPGKGKKRKRKKQQDSEEADRNEVSHATIPWPGMEITTDNVQDNEARQDEILIVQGTVSDEAQEAVDEQLRNDATEYNGNRKSLLEDLAPLPEDMSIYPTIARDALLPGAVLAFKQLDMSQETKWQPKISAYRTAEVKKVLDGDYLEVCLARRDRITTDRSYDNETGERLYSKFEMPDYDDEEPGKLTGVVEVSFADMIEPKLIMSAIPQLQAHQTEIEILDMSTIPDADGEPHVTASQVARPIQNTNENRRVNETPDISLLGAPEELPYHVREESRATEMDKETKDSQYEISPIEKGAEVCSVVRSDLEHGLGDRKIDRASGIEKSGIFDNRIQSPRFNGFSSSPPSEENSKLSTGYRQNSAQPVVSETGFSDIDGIKTTRSQYSAWTVSAPTADGVGGGWNPSNSEDIGLKHPTLPSVINRDIPDIYRAEDLSSFSSVRPSQPLRQKPGDAANSSVKEAPVSILDDAGFSDQLPTIEELIPTTPARTEKSNFGDDEEVEKVEEADDDDYDNNDNGNDGGNGGQEVGHHKRASESTTKSRLDKNQNSRTTASLATTNRFATSPVSSVGVDSTGDIELPAFASTQPVAGTQIVDLTFSSGPVESEGSDHGEQRVKKTLATGPGFVKKARRARLSKLGRKVPKG